MINEALYIRQTLVYASNIVLCGCKAWVFAPLGEGRGVNSLCGVVGRILCAELWGEFSVRNLPAPQGEGMGVGSVIFPTSTIPSSFRA